MSNFAQALEAKISALEEAKASLLSEVSDIDVKISILRELQAEENGEQPAPKRRGRPPKVSKEKGTTAFPMDPSVVEEARGMGGTDPEVAARLAARSVKRNAGPVKGYGPGVRAGTKDQVLGSSSSAPVGAAHISIEDDENEPV